MTRLFHSGFETGDFKEWNNTSAGTCSVQSTTKRTGAYAMQVNPTTTGTGKARWLTSNSETTVYTRFFFRYATKPASNDEDFCAVLSSGSVAAANLSIRLTSGGVIKVYTEASTLLATGTTVLSSGTWYRIEVKAVIAGGASDAYEVKIDGTSEVSGTRSTVGGGHILGVNLGKQNNFNGQTVDYFYDDVAFDDAAYPGAGQTQLLVANADGTFTAWSGAYTTITEIPNDGATSKITSSTLNQAATYNFQDTAGQGISGTINAVNAIFYVNAAHTNAIGISLSTDHYVTNSFATPTLSATGSYVATALFQALQPSGAAWTLAAIDILEAGVLQQDSGNLLSVSGIYVMVDFTPSPGGSVLPFLIDASEMAGGFSSQGF